MRAFRSWPVAAAVLLTAAVPAAHAQDDWYFRRPGHLNGVIRPGEGERAPLQLESVRDVFTLVRTCWRLAPRRLTFSGQEVTVRMSFNRRGEIIGKPRVTYYRPGSDPEGRDLFVNSVLTAFRLCTPLPFSDGLGSAVAGRPFTFRFVDSRPPTRT